MNKGSFTKVNQHAAGLLAFIEARAGAPTPSATAFPFLSLAQNGTVIQENTLVDVTANAVVVGLASGLRVVTVRDRTGLSTPSIGFTAADGLVEDPNNLGTFLSEAVMRTVNGTVTWRWNGAVYEVISST